eukprot:1196119-Prorocentrum_minimum.AAC.7
MAPWSDHRRHHRSNLSGFHEISSGGQHVSTYDIPRGAIYDWSAGATRVKILLVHLPKNPNSRANVAATWHSLLITMISLLVTIITFGQYIRLLYVPSRPGTNAI